MANTVSSNISVFAQGAIEGFTEILAPINTFSTNYSPAEGQVGQAVEVNLYGSAGTAKSFNGEYTVDDQAVGKVTVNLNQWFYKAVHATDKEIANQGVDLFKLGKFAGHSVALSVTTGCLGLITTGAYGLPVQTLGGATNFAASGVLAGRTKAATWGMDKNLIMDSTYYTSLLGNLPNSDMIQTEAAKEGALGKLYGFNLYESNVSPLAGNSQTKAVFASPDAVAIASRVLPPDEAAPGGTPGVEFEVVTDPKTKLSLSVISYYEPSKRRRVYVPNWMGGYAIGNTGAASVVYGN